MQIFMAVTPDQYELPMCVCESAQELADKLGISKSTVKSQISLKASGVQSGRKLIKFELED